MGRQETWSQGAALSTGVRNPALEPVGLDLNLTLIGGNVGHHQPSLGLLSWFFCTMGERVLAHLHGPFLLHPQEKPSPGERPGLSQQRRHQSWSTFKSMTLGSLPPKPRERLALHRAAAWEPTEPPDGDFQTEV